MESRLRAGILRLLWGSLEKDRVNMANAKQCDRCGAFYEIQPLVDDSSQFRLEVHSYPLGENPIEKDLCLSCIKDIMKNITKNWK